MAMLSSPSLTHQHAEHGVSGQIFCFSISTGSRNVTYFIMESWKVFGMLYMYSIWHVGVGFFMEKCVI